MQHIQDNQGTRPSQHGIRKEKSYLTNLIPFYDQVTHPVDEGKVVDVVYLDFSKAFDNAFPGHSSGKAGSPWLGQAHSSPGLTLVEWPGPENGGEWSCIQLASSH